MNQHGCSSNIVSGFFTGNSIFQDTSSIRGLSNKVRNEHDHLQARWTGDTLRHPPRTVVNTKLNASINDRCYVVRVALNTRCQLQQRLGSPTRQSMSSQHETRNNSSHNGRRGTTQSTGIGNSGNDVILQCGQRFTRGFKGSLAAHHHVVGKILGHFLGTLTLGGDFKLFRSAHGNFGPQIDRNTDAVISWSYIGRSSRHSNGHRFTRRGIFIFNLVPSRNTTTHLLLVIMRKEEISGILSLERWRGFLGVVRHHDGTWAIDWFRRLGRFVVVFRHFHRHDGQGSTHRCSADRRHQELGISLR
mmetsp:Transcript_48747/g.137131  ORF Transcript_48747/g.137131 Transcript_48747/m.137131 type:complete len:303 (+) Transcript_48747:172-1080(+)